VALFADGVHDVTIEDEDGSRTSVPVVNSTVAVIDANAKTLSWFSGAGQPFSAPAPGEASAARVSVAGLRRAPPNAPHGDVKPA
jgi:hypothetical protein